MNVQAACDAHCRFLFIGVAAPGVMPDRDALNEVELGKLIESLPLGFVAIGDAAYAATERMCALFYGNQAKQEENDNFNFYGSQCRIRIEMAFGLLNMKFEVLQKNIKMRPKLLKKHLIAIARLHNYCINERLAENGSAFDTLRQAEEALGTNAPTTLQDRNGNPVDDCNSTTASIVQPSERIYGFSAVREAMVEKVKKAGLKRPVKL